MKEIVAEKTFIYKIYTSRAPDFGLFGGGGVASRWIYI